MISISKPLICSSFVVQNCGNSIFILVLISLTHVAVLIILICMVFPVALAYSLPFNTSFCKVCISMYANECRNKRNWFAVKFCARGSVRLKVQLMIFNATVHRTTGTVAFFI